MGVRPLPGGPKSDDWCSAGYKSVTDWRTGSVRSAKLVELVSKRAQTAAEAAVCRAVRDVGQDLSVAATDRAFDRGTRKGIRSIRFIGEEFRDQRLALGHSQRVVAEGGQISRARLSRIEGGKVPGLPILEAAQIAGTLGLDFVIRVYPGAEPLRDSARSARLLRLLKQTQTPLTYALEVPLPALPDRPEQRAWDAVIRGDGKRTAVELEMRLRDGQALERRLNLKRRDDPTEAFVLLVADTRTNRRVLVEHPDLFSDLPRLRPSRVHAALSGGAHPPSGILLV